MSDNKFERGIVFGLAESVEYATGSIVSKILIKGKSGDLSLFAFDKDQRLSEHTAPFDAFVEIVDGEAEIVIDKKPNYLKKGDCIIMPANIPHALNAKEKFKMMLVLIKE